MSEHLTRAVAIEALKVDIRFGLEDKKEQYYNVIFSFRDGKPYRWDINVKYDAFQELNKSVSTVAGHIMSTEFPKALKHRSAFKVKLSQSLLDQRRNDLTLWLRELVANYDLLPSEVQSTVIRFFSVPADLNLRFTTKDQMSDGSRTPLTPARDSPVPLRIRNPAESEPSSEMQGIAYSDARNSQRHFSETYEEFGTPLEPSERPPKKVHPVSSLFLNILELVEIVTHSAAPLHTSTTTTRVLCISRSEALTEESVKPIARLFWEDLAGVYFFGTYCALLFCIIVATPYDEHYNVALGRSLLNTSIIALCLMLFHDQYHLHSRNTEITRSNAFGYDRLQFAVDTFLQRSDESLYLEYLAPYFGMDFRVRQHHRPVYGSELLLASFRQAKSFKRERAAVCSRKEAAIAAERESFDEIASPNDRSDSESGAPRRSGSLDDRTHGSGAAAAAAVEPETPDPAVVLAARAEQQRKLAARKAFDDFIFPGISTQAAAMFIDRRYTHNFNVRGAQYLTDKKKIHPGSAMCKLMLLELYEVDTAKDGDRHDHVASRGLARARREVIAGLPGSPFQFIVNFQIPGDPPVSVVAYFALPPDLAERYQASEVEVFQSLFSQFINLPASECERLATWGVMSPAGVASASGGEDTGNNSEASDGEGAGGDSKTPDTGASSADTGKGKSGGGGGWFKMPSDIRWPDPHEPGALPQTDFRNLRFKLIPSIIEGPWVVKKAVGAQPALLGRKVVQRYFRGEGYFELDIHVGSSGIAMNVVGLCRGYTKMAAADIGIVIQGESAAELPEKMLGCVCFNKIDMEVRQRLD